MVEVKQQAYLMIGGFEVIHALGFVNFTHRMDDLQLDKNTIFDQQIHHIIPNIDPIIHH